MGDFDFEKEKATSAWLSEFLKNNGFLSKGEVSSIDQVAADVFGTSANFHELQVEYSSTGEGTCPQSILMKVMKAGIQKISQKEIDFYEIIFQSHIELPLLKYYGSEISEEKQQAVLLFENLIETHRGIQPILPPVKDQCEQAITAIAEVHGFWWDHPCFGDKNFVRTPESEIREFYHFLERKYVGFMDFLKDRLSSDRRKIYDKIFEKVPDLVLDRLSNTSRLTVVHGDAHFGNFLYPSRGGTYKTVLIDWQSWELGLGAKDIAKMLALHFNPDFRQRMEHSLLKLYHEELQKQVKGIKWQEFQEDYRVYVIDNLLIPIYQYSLGIVPVVAWWLNLENGFSAFEDHNCRELL